MPIIPVEYHFAVQQRTRTRAGYRSEDLRATMPVSFAEADERSCPPVATVLGARGDQRRYVDATPSIEELRVHAWAGGFVTALEEEPGEDGLPILAPPDGYPNHSLPSLFVKAGMSAIPREELRWRGDFQSWEDRARAEVLAKAARMCMLDGRLMVPCPEPVIAVRRFNYGKHDRIEVVPQVTRSAYVETAQLFSLSRMDRAMEHARALADRHGLPLETYGSFELAPGVTMPYDGLTGYAHEVLKAHHSEFASHAWCKHPAAEACPAFVDAIGRLQGALDDAVAGVPAAIHTAFQALGDARDAYPAEATTGIQRFEDLLRGRLDGAIMAFRAFEAERADEAEADVEAIPLRW